MIENRIGQQFGNYRLLRLLGSGGFAEVYLGEHVYMQSQAAVKVLYGRLATSEAQRFLHEARTLALLEHINIVRVLEFDIKQGIPFLVMHYASNGTLPQHHPRGQRVPLETIVPYVQQIASALQYAHDRQIVHRDVKPENMLMDNNSNILLSDFGIAVLSSSTHSHSSSGQAGTYSYMAPEQITGKALPASDQYALGITVYEWLCGEAPFVGSATEITAKHLQAPPPLFREKGLAIEPQIEAVVRHTLEKDPRQRFASVKEFALALQSSSNAQQSKGMYSSIPSSNNSILPSPSQKTPGFTNPTAAPPPVAPRLTPHIAYSIEPTIPSKPSPQLTPPTYPGNIRYASPQPVPHPVQPRKTGLVITAISVVLLLVIGFGSVFALPQLSHLWLSAGPYTPPTATLAIAPTPTPTTTPTPTQAAGPTGPVTNDDVKARMQSFCFDLAGGDAIFTQKAYNQMSDRYQAQYGEPEFASMNYAKTGTCTYDHSYLLNRQSAIYMHVDAGRYTVTIIYDPRNHYESRVDNIQPSP